MKKPILLLSLAATILSCSKTEVLDANQFLGTNSPNGALITDVIPSDIQIPLQSVLLTHGNSYGNETADKTMDSSYSTHYSSSRTALGDSVILDYMIEGLPARVDIVNLIQRTDQNPNSTFSKGSIWYKSESNTEWQFAKLVDVEAGHNGSINVNIANPTQLRICLRSRAGHAVALAEVELWEVVDKGDVDADLVYFIDDSFSVLKPTTTASDIQNISNPLLQLIAQDLLDKTYENRFRAKTYQSQRTPSLVSSELKIGSQSLYDNPTGIFIKEGQRQHIFVGKGAGAPVTLVVTDFRNNGGTERVQLVEGLNSFTSRTSGSGYIQYYTDAKTPLQGVNIHFAYGNEVGFWDLRNGDTADDFNEILTMAETCYAQLNHTNGFMTVLGDKAQLLNTVSAFRAHCTDINRTIELQDQILEIEYTMMGLTDNNAVPANRKLSRRTWGGLPHWGGSSANYPNLESGMLSENGIKGSLWMLEIGRAHV